MPIARVQHVPFWNDLSPLTCCHHWDDSGTATLYNTGCGVTLQLKDYQHVPSVYGGPIVGTYHLHRVNFHWGSDNENGAHHLIGDTPCAMEIHATYYNSCCDFPLRRVSSMSEMSSWAVIGMRFTEGARNNAFRTIAQSVQSIKEPGSSTKVKYDYLSWLKRPRMDRCYLTYISELNDSSRVTWIIYDEPNTISKAQADVFRTILKNDGTPMLESRCKLPVNPVRGEIVFVRDTPFLSNIKRQWFNKGFNRQLI